MNANYAKRMDKVKASEIREILKVTEKPEMISFAGGLPAPELFPIEEMKEIAVKVLEENGRQALQYSTTEGYTPLRRKIAERMNKKFGTDVTENDILIISGSQQGLDFSGKIFLDEGDVVLCESPTYLGAINAFNAYCPKFIEIPTDENGMNVCELGKVLESTPNCKLIYVIPDFQNPTGRTWSLETRKDFMQLISKYDITVIEDNPYGELRFEGEILPSLKSLDTKGQVVFLGTFSKTFCPGLRIGWVAAEKEILSKYILVKQASDLHTASVAQRETFMFMEDYDLDGHVEKIKAVYRKRRDLAVKTMREEFPEGFKFTYPQGGLFTWVELPTHMDARKILEKCMECNVAFVPGGSFFPNGGKENTFRLNYSNMPEDRIVEGMKRLAGVLRQFI